MSPCYIAAMHRGPAHPPRAVSREKKAPSVLELAILGLLKEQPMHGYELRKQLSQKLGFFWTVSFGSLYPTLKKLERRGVVEVTGSGEVASRRRLVYSITPRGEDEFLELLAESAGSTWEEEKFPLRLAFFRYLKPETRIRLLERRKLYLEDKLDFGRASLRRSLERKGGARTDSYTLSLMRHGLDTTERDIAWLDELIATERRLLAAADELPDEDAGGEPAAAAPERPTPAATPLPEELQSQ
jgi:DNA-binding PadR family transcriptional regulator